MTPARYVAPPLAWKSPQTSNVELRAPPASQPSPPASIHSSAKAKETDPTHSQRSSPDIRATPGGIIPEWWARINRNAGRQLIGMGGRHHLGIRGRIAPESAESREIRSFECDVCGRTIENWNSAWVPRYRFIACPATEIRMTTTPNALGTLTRSQDPNLRPNCPLVQN